MNKFNLRPLPLALACLLAPFHAAFAADANASITIPLDVIQENYVGGQFGYRLGIDVGVNGATPEEYIFDTGSTAFNIDVGSSSTGQPWFPLLPGVPVTPSSPAMTLYGNGTYGNLGANTTVASVQFYNVSNNSLAANFNNSQGIPVLINQGSVATAASLGGDQAGAQVGYFLPAYGYGFTNAETAEYGLSTQGGVPMYLDATWQQNLNQGIGPEDGGGAGLFGIFGAGEFGNDSILGNLTTSGYVVAANSQHGSPADCSGCDHVILNLNPAIRAQFLSLVPWNGGSNGTFPLSGAPVSANQFDLNFVYTLNGGKYNANLQTLLDSGTPTIYLNDAGLLSSETAAGNVNASGDEIPGITLTMTGAASGAQPTSILTGNDAVGDVSNVVTPGPDEDTNPGQALYGISFFFNNSVMYDLQNEETGYTPFFVTIDPISTTGTGYTVTAAMTPQGLAGTISGSGPFQVASGGIADLSGTNTYTGATSVANGGWLALAGPGSIAASSDVHVDGTFDISRTWQPTTVQSLSGAGLVQLGDTTLDLTRASGSFSGQITDGGIGGGTGGRLVVSGGRETLTGANTYTGATGVSAGAALDVEGSLVSGVANLGMLVNNGSIQGNVLNGGLLAGHGQIGGSLANTGIVAPGNGPGQYQTLSVAGDYTQSANSSYLVQIDPAQPGVSSLLSIGKSATLASGADLDLADISGGLYQSGARYTVLDANGGVSGQYRLVGDTILSAVLGLAPSYDANHVYLTVMQTRPLASAGGTRNEIATLGGVQSLAPQAPVTSQPASAGLHAEAYRVAAFGTAQPNAVFTTLANLSSDAALRAAADQLSGEIHATAQGVLLENSRYVRDAVTARLRQAGEGLAGAGGPSVQDGAGGLAWWGQFVGEWGQQDSNGNAASTKSTSSGLLLGADHALGEHTRLGLVAGYTQTSLNTAARDSSLSSHDADLGAYIGTQFGNVGLRAGADYAWHSLRSTRFLTVPGLAGREAGSYDADTTQAFGEAAYRFTFKRATLEPFAQAAWVRLHTDAFQERGGAAALYGNGVSHTLGYSTLGARLAAGFPFHGNQRIDLHAMLGWRRAWGRTETASAMAFAGGSPFVVDGLPVARNALAADAGFSVQVAKHASFDLSWQGQLAHQTTDSGFRGSFDWRF